MTKQEFLDLRLHYAVKLAPMLIDRKFRDKDGNPMPLDKTCLIVANDIIKANYQMPIPEGFVDEP